MKPVLQALLLAEHVYEDKAGKKIICGTFNHLIRYKESPIQQVETDQGEKRTRVIGGGIGAPYVYMSLTDVCDNTELQLHIVNLSKNSVIFRIRCVIKCNNRLAPVEFFAPLPAAGISFGESGTYAIEIVCEGEVIGSHRIIVTDARTGD